ncbi:MAG: Uma2 family endonuclease [Vulcanimicrobiota bacterium]
MALQPQTRTYTSEEYLTLERQSEGKSEYVDGMIYAMSGASIPHSIIVANIIGELIHPLRTRGCQIFPSDLKVRQGTRFFYPDVSAVCGELQFHDSAGDVVLNPSLIMEVLSPSTENYDKGMKFLTYQKIPSLQEYLLVHQDRMLIEQYRRHSDSSWLYLRKEGEESLEVLECPLSLSALYAGITLPPEETLE